MTQKTTKSKAYKDLWTYKELYQEYPLKEEMDIDTFRLILKTFNNLLMQALLEEGKVFRLPYGLGVIGVFSRVVGNKFNYQYYKETGEKTVNKNLHAGGRVAGIKLRTKHVTDITASVYKFRTCRYAARRLAKLIKEQNTMHKYLDYEAYFD